MSANTDRLNDALVRLTPFIIVVVIVTIAYFLVLQAPLNAYVRSRTDVTSLQARLKTLHDASARAATAPPVDLQASIGAYEQQMAADEKVSDVTALLAKVVLDHAPASKLRGFSIESSDRITVTAGESRLTPGATAGNVGAVPDPRLSLFPGTVSYTPVKVTFSSTFEAIADVIWNVQDLPTIVEIKSATLTRGLPLMKLELLIWVYQRSTTSQEPGVAPPTTATPTTAPAGPRVASLTRAEG